MKINKLTFIFALGACLGTQVSRVDAGWMDVLESAVKPAATTPAAATSTPTASVTGLSQDEMSLGLKEALVVGVKQAIAILGKEGGYLNDESVKIPLPAILSSASKLAPGMVQGLTDEFIVTLNRAAEKAVPVAMNIFVESVQKMSLTDAQTLLQGADNAATEYFRKTSSEQLISSFKPIVEQTTDEVGLTSAYKNLSGMLQKQGTANQVISGLSSFMGGGGQNDFDLDGYVTQKAVDGLFLKMAEEEKKIRQNPLARSSDLLQKVFSVFNN
ncbi:MAG: DUF4197 domain-containing protein [Magnetococcales bacterium]|nr:DUF4197 domain-containing protein [Magnetococcales bacterium]